MPEQYHIKICPTCGRIFKHTGQLCPICTKEQEHQNEIKYLEDMVSLFKNDKELYLIKYGYLVPVTKKKDKKLVYRFSNNDMLVQMKCCECGTTKWITYFDCVMGKTRCSNLYYCPIYNNGNRYVYVR